MPNKPNQTSDGPGRGLPTRIPEGFPYRQILLLGRPRHEPWDRFSARHPRMDPGHRAKIFAPFDALRGFDLALTAKRVQIEAGYDEEDTRRELMCTRFYIDISDEELQDIISAAEGSALTDRFLKAGSPLHTSGEIRPTDVTAAIATSRSGKRTVFPMRWGFHLSGRTGTTMLLNARSETAARKQTFRESWQTHRCIRPASYYFDWEHHTSPSGRQRAGQKYAIQPRGSARTWLCGLYRMEEGLPHFVVLTREPSEDIAFIHDRMPLILPGDLIDQWIDPAIDASKVIGRAVNDVVFETA
ncbi:MAG: SOS response-associated peptidase family protein [Firmicutes bacterium]|nr:SOS response-associated peptidase family protein [Bacillota bacterium]